MLWRHVLLTSVFASSLFVTASFAEVRPETWSITPFVGGYTFDGSQRLETKPVYGLRAGYEMSKRWGVEGVFDYVATKLTSGGNAEAYGYRLDGLYHFMPESRLVPFLAAGIGGTSISKPDKDETSPSLNYGGGVKYSVSENWDLRGDVRHILVFDKIDKVFSNLEYTVGLTYLFGAKKAAPAEAAPPPAVDSDNDGVPDNLDKCPDTPRGVAVDKDGCPLDTDGDGVYDYLDKCPDTPKGVAVDKNGCPLDTDGDGVYDYLDKCPDTPKGVAVDKDGCPLDTDGDGVFDYLDKCPGTPKGAAVDKNGCTAERVSIRLDIKFDTDKADIKPEYNDEIKKVGDMMNKYPEIKMLIEGHTDNVGPVEYNKDLSLRRADAVKQYLVEKFGIAPERLTAKGFGPTNPVADNSTPEGRQKNRRIEAVIEYAPNP